MNLETQTDLDKTTLRAANNLVQANIDSAKGFEEIASEVSDKQLSELFRSIGETRRTLIEELQQHIKLSGETPPSDGTWLAALHRSWIDLRSAISGGDPKGILIEAERGEDYIKQAYEDVIKRTAGSALNAVLLRQYETVKKGHASIRTLREALVE
ncbi:PA2169 family four-helix-bundle protein [Stieleria sp. JC731]|uniref:PA2169 family four-helix-bundle protein n=1 Tax=Pirellulaceae TaxID=2691357 RepID=UPI001E401282|nr:PA2169 family four-helix-bundle protein [Stieleria sp. JC731]MCC9602776.1 PA2169 family four-helix-bundle protein [Stieleria sp. JC731]